MYSRKGLLDWLIFRKINDMVHNSSINLPCSNGGESYVNIIFSYAFDILCQVVPMFEGFTSQLSMAFAA
jgi:hypothetical protein